jgi:hypothetical protein
MFSQTSRQEFKGEVKTLRLTRDPFYYGLGDYEDIDGVKWNVRCVIGIGERPYVNATRADNLHPYFGSTANEQFGLVTQSWEPYYVVVVDENDEVVKEYK